MPAEPAALAPYRVLDLTDVDGWLCGRVLADLGAEVIKIEPPDGDPGRRLGRFAGDDHSDLEANLAWWFANAGKQSVVLDLTSNHGKDHFRALVQDADVVLHSPASGALSKANTHLTPSDLLQQNPRLVVTSLSPFGLDGPYAQLATTDLVVAALSGLMWLTGDPDRPPLRVSTPQTARLAAAEAAVHTLVALHHAARTGQGQHVDAAALPAMVRTVMNAAPFRALMGWEMVRMGSGVPYAPGRPRHIYRCADGHVTYLAALGPLAGPGVDKLRRWADAEGILVPPVLRDLDLLDAGGWARLDAEGRGQELVTALEQLAENVLAGRSKDDLYRTALQELMLLAPVNTVADLRDDEQLAARAFWRTTHEGADDREVIVPGPWARLAATPLRCGARSPRLGEHTDKVLASTSAVTRAVPRHAGAPRPSPTTSPGPSPTTSPGPSPTTSPGPSPDPFAGLKVWDMSWVGVGPLTARYLADYGATVVRLDNTERADVLRVNPPFLGGVPGINRSQFYADFNASKLGIGLDLGNPRGREIALRLASWADVVVESFTPHTLRSLGLDYERLREVNPELVMLSTCMQGQTGPRRDYRGFGQLMGSLSGFYEMTGWPDRDPSMVYGAYTDFICQRFCASALIAAIDHRRRTGQGQHIDVAQFEAALQVLGPEILDFTVNGRVATRHGNRDPYAAPHGVYPCLPEGDGLAGERWLAIACTDDAQWSALVDHMGRPAWAAEAALTTLAGRKAVEDLIDEHLAEWTSQHRAGDLFRRLQPSVAAAPVQAPGELIDDPQLQHLGYWPILEHTVMGPVPYNGMQARLSLTPGRPRKAAPCVGEDSLMVLVDLLGYDEDEVAELLACEAVEINVG